MPELHKNDKRDKIRGSLIGGAIGDALGYQIEFKRNIKEKEVTKFINTPAIVSDDTQMTLFTANGALSSGIKGTVDKPINNSKGCGGIMRVAPVGLYMSNSENAGKYGADIGAITHGHQF